MRRAYGAALAVVLVAAAVGAAPPDSIRLPSGPVVPQPMPPAPGGAVRLTADLLYVIDSDVPCLVLASPAGLVTVSEESGPVKIFGRFVDEPGRSKTRTFKGKAVFTVEAVKSGRVELLVVPVGAAKADQVIRRTIDVDAGEGPQPPPVPPKPDDPPAPKPVDPPAPIPGEGLRVLVVYESADGAAITAGQYAAMYGKASRELLNEKCAAGPDGKTREWRIYDKDTDAARDSKLWADAMKRPRGKLPWLVISNGVTGFEGPLVDDRQLAELVKKYGG